MPLPPTLPPIADQPLGVLLLARQAGDHAEAVVRPWLAWLDSNRKDFELLVVDDASDDGTAEKVQAIAHPRLRVIRHEAPQGEGAALRTGLEALTQPLLFYTLLSPEFGPEPLERMLAKQVPVGEDGKPGREIDHVHLVSGYRAAVPVPGLWRGVGWLWRSACWLLFAFAPEKLPGWLGWRRHLAWVWLRLVFGLRYPDALCPYRLLRRDILPRIRLQSASAFAHAELLAKANFLGFMLGGEQARLDVAPPGYRGDWKALFRDAMKVQNDPDFGPTVLGGDTDQGPGTSPAEILTVE